jgi:hypothetical protein
MNPRAFLAATFLVNILAGPPALAAAPQARRHMIVGVSPRLDSASRPEVERKLLDLVLAGVPPGSTVRIIDAYNLALIAQFDVPDEDIFKMPALRTSHFPKQLGQLHRFFSQAADPGDAAVRTPQFLRFLGANVDPGVPRTLILIGSPLYVDDRDGAASMVEPAFPCDGHLRTAADASVYSTAGREQLLAGLRVHVATLGPVPLSDAYRFRIERFWSLFVQRQGGQLVTFARDVPTTFERALDDLSRPAGAFAIDDRASGVRLCSIAQGADETAVEIPPAVTRQASVRRANSPLAPNARPNPPRSHPAVERVVARDHCEPGRRNDSTRRGPGLRILSPLDRSTLEAYRGERSPIQRSVSGDVTGLSQDVAEDGMQVRVSVFTTQEYPQGIAKVHAGHWQLPTVYFGGSIHRIRAELIDSFGNVVASASSTVTVVYP